MKIPEKCQIYNLRETYSEYGVYEFRFVLNKRFFKNGHDLDVFVFDSSGKKMEYEIDHWGRKLNCRFVFNSGTAEGVSQARLFVSGTQPLETVCTARFWMIKPD